MTEPRPSQRFTLYGRKPVLEALKDPSLSVQKLHLSNSVSRDGIITDILNAAAQRSVATTYHDKQKLSRISKNARQDQGVALDIHLPALSTDDEFIAARTGRAYRLMAVDGITNPQNLGMIIRSVCASPLDGLLLPSKGCCQPDPLVIKASAGTFFKCTIIRCGSLEQALEKFSKQNCDICVMDSNASLSLFDYTPSQSGTVYVVGNETEGISNAVKNQATHGLRIPLNHGVESLNVAVTASLTAFSTFFK